MIIVVFLLYILIFYFDFLPLYKSKRKKELIIYSITVIFSFILSMLFAIGIDIPSPAPLIQQVVFKIIGIKGTV